MKLKLLTVTRDSNRRLWRYWTAADIRNNKRVDAGLLSSNIAVHSAYSVGVLSVTRDVVITGLLMALIIDRNFWHGSRLRHEFMTAQRHRHGYYTLLIKWI